MADQWKAYVTRSCTAEPSAVGPLSGLNFAVKDVFAIAGHISGAGNPDWLRTHGPSLKHAASVELLLRAGARLNGVTHTDELMYSLNGENSHYGTPVNPAAPNRIPGGSSSGSAVAAAAGFADFALGTDTGGSVRIPSSYCGIYGFRPTHDAVSLDGVIPLASSFDTVGWMSAELKVVLEAGKALLPGGQDTGSVAGRFGRIVFGADAWALADPECRDVLAVSCASLSAAVGASAEETIADVGLAEWMDVFRIHQGLEIWRTHGEWIDAVQPAFGPGIAERFAWAKSLAEGGAELPAQQRADIRGRLSDRLGDDTLLVVPTAPGPAPILGLGGPELERRRTKTLQLTCIAGLCGLPQLTMPLGQVDGAPVGLSIIAGPGQDRKLLEFAAAWSHYLAPAAEG